MNRALLELLKSRLEDDGISSIIKNADPPAVGEVTPIVAWPELWVIEDRDYRKADNLVQQELKKLKDSESQDPWKCPKCRELIEAQFDICWKCSTSKP